MEGCWSANPDAYNSVHDLTLKSDGTCYFLDGGGQNITGDYQGTWIFEKNQLTLHYTSNDGKKIKPILIECSVVRIVERTLFFNGYAVYSSEETLILDSSPCPRIEKSFCSEDVCSEDENYPLIFYKNPKPESIYIGSVGYLRKFSQTVWKSQPPIPEDELEALNPEDRHNLIVPHIGRYPNLWKKLISKS